MYEHYPFQLQPLPYPFDALEPYIIEEIMVLHHNKHLKTYVDNLNKALAPYPRYHNLSLASLLLNKRALPLSIQTTVENNAGGVYNHNLFFLLWGKMKKMSRWAVLQLQSIKGINRMPTLSTSLSRLP